MQLKITDENMIDSIGSKLVK